MSAIDDLIASAAPRTEEVRVCARGDLVDQHARLVVEMSTWMDSEGDGALAMGSNVRDVHARLAAIEAEIEASTVVVRIQAVPAYKWANLLMKNPPTREQREAGCDNNPDKFPIAVVSACAIEPTISIDQAQKLRDTLSTPEWNNLWLGCLLLNTQEAPSPKLAAATASLLANDGSSTPASTEGSLAEPSSDGSGAQ